MPDATASLELCAGTGAPVNLGCETLLDVLDLLADIGLQTAWMLTLPDFDD